MKILHIIDSLGLGGAQTVVKGIFEYQQNNKNIFLFSLRKKEINIKIEHSNVFIFNSKKKYSFYPIKDLVELIKKENIDILHCHLFRSMVFGFLLKKFYFPNIKLVFHEHGRIFTNSFTYNIFLKFSKSKVNLFLAVSKATKNNLIKYGKVDNDKIKVLYNFVDLDKFNKNNIKWDVKEEKNKLGINDGEFVVGFMGRLAEIKGCEYFIKALSYLNFPYKALIIGDGPEKNKLENLAKDLNVYDKIIFLGYQENVVFYYSLFDCLVVPSLSESFGLSIVEAQALGIPVVSSNVPALNEIIEDNENGLLFELNNSYDLADKIKLIYSNDNIKKNLILNALNGVRRFDLINYVKDLNKIYE